MIRPQVSVIMSVYNGMPFVRGAVESILGQTLKSIELIVVNDASTDRTTSYLNSVKDKRIKVIENKKNLGLAASLNKGLKISRGNFIARMDADDVSLPKRLKTQLEYMQNHKNIDICGTWVKLIDERDNEIGSVHKPVTDKEIKRLNRWMTGIVHPTWFVKKKVFQKLGRYSEDWDYVEDMEFLLRAKNFKMANIPEELVLWRSPRNRRSKENIEKIYRESLKLRLHYFLKGDFGLTYLPYLIRSAVTTYLFPTQLKIYLNKKAGLI